MIHYVLQPILRFMGVDDEREQNMGTAWKKISSHNSGKVKRKTEDTSGDYTFKPFVFESVAPPIHWDAHRLTAPEPRSGHRIVCHDGNFYSFGGYLEVNDVRPGPPLIQATQRLFEELWCFNYAQRTWKRIHTDGRSPKELASHSAVLDGNYLVVFGGTGVPFGGCSSNKINICDLRSLTWIPHEATGEAPSPAYGQAVVLQGKTFYVIGGTTGYDYSMDIHKLDMNTFHWETLFVSKGDSSEPPPRYRHEVAFDGERIYVLGGGTATNAYDLTYVPAFDIKTRSWSIIETIGDHGVYPRPRKCQGSVQKDDDVFIGGGYDSKHIFMDLWKLHLPKMQWSRLSVKMPIPLYFHSANITRMGCMYMFGGVTNIKDNTRTNEVFKIWLGIPKLKEISWEAVLHYIPAIKSYTLSNLLKMGIPKEYAERIFHTPPCACPCIPEVSVEWQLGRASELYK